MYSYIIKNTISRGMLSVDGLAAPILLLVIITL